MSDWQTQKDRFLSMSLSQKRTTYNGKKFNTLKDIPTWKDYAKIKKSLPEKIPSRANVTINSNLNSVLSQKISIFPGDITSLEIDVIVNAANKTLLGGGGVDGAIHYGAGPLLLEECKSFKGCDTGEVRLTGGYNLPAQYVIHTPGPIGEIPRLLQQCYKNSLKLMLHNKLKSIAFPCISTGMYGYPNEAAAHVAVYEIREHLERHGDEVDRVIFCIFLEEDLDVYERVLQSYFPVN